MALNKTTYVDGETVIYAQNLNDIQDEIIANGAAITGLDEDKVDKVSGKGLSTNDYTTAEKTKLAGIQAGAQVNPGNATTTSAGLMSADDKTKLNGIESQANKTIIDSTLSQPGQAADAKAVGDSVGNLQDTLGLVSGDVAKTRTTASGLYITGGKLASTSGIDRTICVEAEAGKTYVIKKATSTIMRAGCGSAADLTAGAALVSNDGHATASADSLHVTTDKVNHFIYIQLFADSDPSSLRSISANVASLSVCVDLNANTGKLETKYDYLADSATVGTIPYGVFGSAGNSDIGIIATQAGNFITLNGTSKASAAQSATKILICDHLHLWNTTSTPAGADVYPIQTVADHTYRAEIAVISGTRDAGGGTGNIRLDVAGSNVTLTPSETETGLTFIGTGAGINILLRVARDMTVTDLVLRVTLRDLTVETALEAEEAALEAETAARETAQDIATTSSTWTPTGDDVLLKYIDKTTGTIAATAAASKRLLVIPLDGIYSVRIQVGLTSSKRYGLCNSLDAGAVVTGFTQISGELDVTLTNTGFKYAIVQLFADGASVESYPAYLAATTITVEAMTDPVARREIERGQQAFFHAENLRGLPTLDMTDISIDTNAYSNCANYHALMATLCESSGGYITQTTLGEDGHGNSLYKYVAEPKQLLYDAEREETYPKIPIVGGVTIEPLTVLFTANCHGRERNGNWVIYNLLSKMLAPDNDMLRFFRRRVRLVCVPYICPTGNYANSDGVNINRDFPTTYDGTCVSNEARLVKGVIDEYGPQLFAHIDIHTFRDITSATQAVSGWIFTDSVKLASRGVVAAEYALDKYASKYPNVAKFALPYYGSCNTLGTCTNYTQTVYGKPSGTMEGLETMDGSPSGSDSHTSAVSYLYDIVTQTICSMVD